MKASLRARSAYGDPRASAKSPQQVEYQAFAKITQDLQGATGDAADQFPRLAAALHENQRLWTIIAGGVSASDNGLPEALRARLFYLAEFTLLHTGKVLRGEAEADALIDINTAVMKGLRQQSEANQCPA